MNETKATHTPKKLSDGSYVCSMDDCTCEGALGQKRCSMCGFDFPVKGNRWCAYCIKEAEKEMAVIAKAEGR